MELAADAKIESLGLPLGLAMMLISLNLNLPRYFVERSLGAYSLGIFAALGYLSVAASTLVNALGLAATPRLSMLFGAGRLGEFLQMLLWSCAGAAVLVSAGIGILLWFGRPLLSLVYGAPYAAHLDVAIWVAAATGLSCMASVFGFGLTAARAFRPQLPLFVVVTLATAFAAYVLVPRYGLIGAAASQVVSAVVQLLGSAGLLLLQCRQKAESLTLVPEAVA